jgi:hypothetical protein
VTDHDLGYRVSVSNKGRTFSFLLPVQTGSGAHPVSCPMVTMERLTTHLHAVPPYVLVLLWYSYRTLLYFQTLKNSWEKGADSEFGIHAYGCEMFSLFIFVFQ